MLSFVLKQVQMRQRHGLPCLSQFCPYKEAHTAGGHYYKQYLFVTCALHKNTFPLLLIHKPGYNLASHWKTSISSSIAVTILSSSPAILPQQFYLDLKVKILRAGSKFSLYCSQYQNSSWLYQGQSFILLPSCR